MQKYAVVVADSYLLLGCLCLTFFQIVRYRKDVFLRLSLGLKMVEVCWSNLTLPIPYSSFNFCFLSNIEFQSLMVSDAFNRLTHRVLQRFTFLHQPIVLIILRPQLSTPQHQLLVFCLSCMKGGGLMCSCTSVQPYITGSRAVFSKILTKSHDILQV